MKDRVAAKPNRYAVYDDNHNFIRYEYHERADEPTQAGDALNKANLLPDAVATALGLTGNPQVKDALLLIDTVRTTANGRAQIAIGSYTGTGTYGSENENSLTLSFAPKVLIIYPASKPSVDYYYILTPAINNISTVLGLRYRSDGNPQNQFPVSFTWSENTVSWSGDSSIKQQNVSGISYKYIVIG